MYYIYLIVNKVNGKTYVGQHKSSNKEWYEEHRKKLSEAHKGQVAWNKGKKGLLHWKLVDGKRVYYKDMEK